MCLYKKAEGSVSNREMFNNAWGTHWIRLYKNRIKLSTYSTTMKSQRTIAIKRLNVAQTAPVATPKGSWCSMNRLDFGWFTALPNFHRLKNTHGRILRQTMDNRLCALLLITINCPKLVKEWKIFENFFNSFFLLAKQLLYTTPWVYGSNLPDPIASDIPDLKLVIDLHSEKNAPYNRTAGLTSAGGRNFTHFGKHAKWKHGT